MVSSLSATDRARVFSSSGRCRSRSVDGCQLSAPLPLSCSPALRATAGATAHRLAQMRRVRPAAVAIFSPEIGFLPRVAQLFRRLPPFLPFRFSGRGKKVGWDRWVDLKIVRFPDPFWDFAPLFLSISRFSLLPPSFARLELVMEDTREEALKGLYTLGHVCFLRFFLWLLVVSYRSLISNYPRFFGNFGNFKKSITWEKYQTPNNTSIPRNI